MCRDRQVACCVQVISTSGAPTFATTEKCFVCMCVERKLGYITGKNV